MVTRAGARGRGREGRVTRAWSPTTTHRPTLRSRGTSTPGCGREWVGVGGTSGVEVLAIWARSFCLLRRPEYSSWASALRCEPFSLPVISRSPPGPSPGPSCTLLRRPEYPLWVSVDRLRALLHAAHLPVNTWPSRQMLVKYSWLSSRTKDFAVHAPAPRFE